MHSGKNLFRLRASRRFTARLSLPVALGLFVVASAQAAPFQPDDWSAFEKDASTSHTSGMEIGAETVVPRVKIPVTIRGFERVAAASSGAAASGARDVTIPRRAQDLNLRARLDRENHFYFENWHVETIPLGKTAAGDVKMKLSLSRTFGEDNDLEEHIGDLEVHGGLTRLEPGLFAFEGRGGSRFSGRNGEPAAELRINGGRAQAPVFPGRVSRLETPSPVKPVDSTPAR